MLQFLLEMLTTFVDCAIGVAGDGRVTDDVGIGVGVRHVRTIGIIVVLGLVTCEGRR